MFNDRNSGTQRRRREDQQVELRRQRTEELLNKKRASTADREAAASFEALSERLHAPALEAIYKAVYECRSSLSVENNPPIQPVIDAGVVPRIIELLGRETYSLYSGASPGLISKTRVEAAWVITNIASGTGEQTEYVARHGAIPPLVSMLGEDDDAIVDQAVWALGNMAGDCETIRDTVLSQGALFRILGLIEKYRVAKEHIKILRNLTWLMANLCRGRNPPPAEDVMEVVEGVVERLVTINDLDVVSDCFWCLSYIVDVSGRLTEAVLASPVMRRCHDLLGAFSASLSPPGAGPGADSLLAGIGAYAICPIIRTLGNIVTGTDEATDAIIRGGFLTFLRPIFYAYQNKKLPRIRKEICWLLSNVTAGTPSQVTAVLESDLSNLLIDAVTKYELYIRKEASFAVTNILHFCAREPQYLQPLLDNHVIQALQNHLEAVANIPDLQAQILDAVRYALEGGEKIRARLGENPVVQIMIDSKLVDEIEELQDVPNSLVNSKAYNIIVDFFEGEDEQ